MRARTTLVIACLLLAGSTAAAQPARPQALDRILGATVVAVRVMALGVEVHDPQVTGLIEIRAGEPLMPAAVRRTIVHLMGLGTYLDVRVDGEPADGGVRVVVELVLLRDVGRLVFSGETGLPDRVLRDAVTLRFGTQPPLGKATDIARTLEEVYAVHGYLRASVRPRALDAPGGAPGDLVFDVEPGVRAVIRAVEFRGAPGDAVARVRDDLGLRPGSPYQPLELRRRLNAHVDTFRAQGFLEARADPFARVDEAGDGVVLTVAVTRGPLVTVQFAGDPLPENERDVLVPVAREGSADEDLLEDSQFRIERFLRGQGYRDARAPFTRAETEGHLRIVFTVTRGSLYRVSGVALNSNAAVQVQDLSTAFSLKPGDPFVQARLDADAAAVLDGLRRRGYTRAVVTPIVTVGGRTQRSTDVPVTVAFQVDEGPRTVVGRVSFEGVRTMPDALVPAGVKTRVGDPYYRPIVEEDRERILGELRDRGYREAGVDVVVTIAADGTEADVRFTVREGRQIRVDHILVVGNTRTSEATIRRELALKPGEPLGDAAVAESQRRL
ncbi:MAG: POTRA domain-containing protein, partial [Vicinamibacterales bacterium]|nr:POTRA domain-containing protein [Vicinamibacterales bacterium]